MRRELYPISDNELSRRWRCVREMMVRKSVEALVVQSQNDWLGGYVKWLTDIPATNGYPRTVIFHLNEPMTVIEMGPFKGSRHLQGNDEINRGVNELIFSPSFLSVAATHGYDGELTSEALKSRKYKKVGIVGGGALPFAFVSRLHSNLHGVTFEDVTDGLDVIKAIKSPEEINAIRQTASMQDEVFAKVLSSMRPGLRDVDVTAIGQLEGQRLGSEQGIFLGGSSRVGIRSPFVQRHLQGRELQPGDHLSLLIENNGPGGFYTEIARTIVLGRASNELLDGFAAVKEAQSHTLSLIKPGASCKEIAGSHDLYMKGRGLPPEVRLYAHGQGYDMVERPLIRSDETMMLAEGMCLAVHPGYETDWIFAVICDNYLVEQSGPSGCLHKTEKKIFEIN